MIFHVNIYALHIGKCAKRKYAYTMGEVMTSKDRGRTGS